MADLSTLADTTKNLTLAEYRAPFNRAALGAERPFQTRDTPRHRTQGGASAVIGDTDIYLHRSYAIVERLRRVVADRSEF